MLIEKVIDHYIEVGKKHPGNPFRLSNSGRCARALAYQRFPSVFKPEAMPARVLMVLEEGKRVDKWLKEEFRKHCTKSWGSEEKEFYIEVDGIKIFGHADGVPALERYGRTVAELKSMSNYGFRNALQGKIDYGYRCVLLQSGLYSNNYSSMTDNVYQLDYVECGKVLSQRLNEPAPGRIQLLTGPRQVGKTTLLLDVAKRFGKGTHYGKHKNKSGSINPP